MKNDGPLQPLLHQASEHFQRSNQTEIAGLLQILSKAAKLRRLNREEIEKISLIFAPEGPWEKSAGPAELPLTLAKVLERSQG